MQRILCPTDLSPLSRRAVQYATDLAAKLKAKLVLLYVEPPVAAAATPAGASVAGYPLPNATTAERFGLSSPQRAAEVDQLQEAMQQAPGTDYELVMRHGDPADVIVNVADEINAEQVVMGTHGRSGLRRVLLGSTAEAVLHKANCPVTVVKHQDDDAGASDLQGP